MRASTSFATLVAFMAVASSAAPIGAVDPSNRAVSRARAHQRTRSLVPDGHLNSVKDMGTSVGALDNVTKNNEDDTLSADLDVGKTSPDASSVLDGLPPVHADVNLNAHDQKPDDEPQHQEEPPKEEPPHQESPHQEPPKDQTPPQDPQTSQNESQPPKNDPQPQPQPQPTCPEPEHHDDNSGTKVEANVSVNASSPDQVKSEVKGEVKDVHDETMHEVKDESKGAVQDVHDMPTKTQNQVASIEGEVHHADDHVDDGLTAGVNVSVNDSQKPGKDNSDPVVTIDQKPASDNDKDLLNVKVHDAKPLSTSIVRRLFDVLGWLA